MSRLEYLIRYFNLFPRLYIRSCSSEPLFVKPMLMEPNVETILIELNIYRFQVNEIRIDKTQV